MKNNSWRVGRIALMFEFFIFFGSFFVGAVFREFEMIKITDFWSNFGFAFFMTLLLNLPFINVDFYE